MVVDEIGPWFWTDGDIIKRRASPELSWEVMAIRGKVSSSWHWNRIGMILTSPHERAYVREKVEGGAMGIIHVPNPPKTHVVYDRYSLSEYLKAKHGISIDDVLTEISGQKEAGQHTILRFPVEVLSAEHTDSLKAEFGDMIAVEWQW